jgi:hypothetical protein
MKQPVKVVMLPTEDKESLNIKVDIFKYNNLVFGGLSNGKKDQIKIVEQDTLNNVHWTKQYVYITVLETVKEGWVYDPTIKKVFYMDSIIGIPNKVFKIIATDDPRLFINKERYLDKNKERRSAIIDKVNIPQLPQSFLKEFVANLDGEFEVEYYFKGERCALCGFSEESNECINRTECPNKYFGGELTLKLNQDNQVNITAVEEKMYSKNDVEDLLHQIVNDSHCMPNRIKQPSSNRCADFTINWIKENL